MAADSDGTLQAVVICEGDIRDPEFPRKFRHLLGRLNRLLEQPKSEKLKVNKVCYCQVYIPPETYLNMSVLPHSRWNHGTVFA